MKVLVTGAGGTLGRPLMEKLRSTDGHDVRGCDLMHGMAYYRADVRDIRQLDRVFEKYTPDYVYHLAAEFGRHNGDEFYRQCWETNAIGTRNIIEMCVKYGVRLIFASSSEIYGELDVSTLEEDVTETAPIRPLNDYAISKWANELQIMNAMETRGLEAVRMRFFNAYGEGELYHAYRSVVCLFTHRALKGEPFTVFRGYHRTFMHISDFIPTLARACEEERWASLTGNVVNIGGNDYRSVEELAEIVLDTTGASTDLIEWQGEDEHNTVSKRPDISRAEELLDHNPVVRLEEGVPLYAEWLGGQ